ncbi:MAG: DUF5610 domain-containing protein [bacterium]|nr:DUF5610 domain-containing protein [bacterium]
MPILTDIYTKSLSFQMTAHKASQPAKRSSEQVETTDKVEISLSVELTVETANGIMLDSVLEQINKVIQEAGIDLKVEDASGVDMSSEATAKRIVNFATGFLDAYRKNHAGEANVVQVKGFMSLTRMAIEEGFQSARDFLEGMTRLSETIDENINQTFALTQQFLKAFQQAELEKGQESPEVASGVEN